MFNYGGGPDVGVDATQPKPKKLKGLPRGAQHCTHRGHRRHCRLTGADLTVKVAATAVVPVDLTVEVVVRVITGYTSHRGPCSTS